MGIWPGENEVESNTMGLSNAVSSSSSNAWFSVGVSAASGVFQSLFCPGSPVLNLVTMTPHCGQTSKGSNCGILQAGQRYRLTVTVLEWSGVLSSMFDRINEAFGDKFLE